MYKTLNYLKKEKNDDCHRIQAKEARNDIETIS